MTISQPTPSGEPTGSAERASASSGGPRASRPTRRKFTTEYKRRMVEEYNTAPPGDKGALLRRENLYHSNIKEWEAKIDAGTLDQFPTRGRPSRTAEQKRIADLEKQVTTLHTELQSKDETIADRDAALDVLGKGVAFLETLSSKNAPQTETNTKRGKPKR